MYKGVLLSCANLRSGDSMRLFRQYNGQYPYRVSYSDLTMQMAEGISVDLLSQVHGLIRGREQIQGKSRASGMLEVESQRLFVKTSLLESWPSRLRVTFGQQRRQGGFDWAVQEVINSVEAYRRGVPTPPLKGFGCRYGSRRLVSEVFMVSEWLEGHVDGLTWLRRPNVDGEAFLRSIFALIQLMHDREVRHLDLWVANVMLDPQNPEAPKVIDLENCYIGRTDFLAETLGFQFGFLFRREVHAKLDEARYDALVEQALNAYDGLDRERFRRVYEVSKRQHIGRKERSLIPRRGLLVVD